jgi:hypothetical protein
MPLQQLMGAGMHSGSLSNVQNIKMFDLIFSVESEPIYSSGYDNLYLRSSLVNDLICFFVRNSELVLDFSVKYGLQQGCYTALDSSITTNNSKSAVKLTSKLVRPDDNIKQWTSPNSSRLTAPIRVRERVDYSLEIGKYILSLHLAIGERLCRIVEIHNNRS